MLFVDIFGVCLRPKRGDLIQTNMGNRRERTWFILRARQVRGRSNRYSLWVARWWELEPEMRLRLYRSAERNGGQQVIFFHRYPPKRKARPLFPMP